MDLNILVLSGRLVTKPDVRVFEGGSTLARYLLAARVGHPRRRVDVVPVVQWNPPEWVAELDRGDALWIAAGVQRRFWSDDNERRGRIEVVAHHVQRRPPVPDDDRETSVFAMVESPSEA